jgi:K+-sensing histidine kinase KdpD
MKNAPAEISRFLDQTRSLPRLDRLLATALLTGAAIYFQLGAGWEFAGGAGPLLALPIVISALLFRMECGLASAAGGAALNWFIFTQPQYSFALRDWSDLVRVGAFVLVGLLAALVLNKALVRVRASA